MKHVFEKDANNATINPLYIQKNTSVETTTTETNIKLSYHWIIFRVILFLIVGMADLHLHNNNITNIGKNQILEVCKSYKNVERCAV